jgi:predicted transcriptional regulator
LFTSRGFIFFVIKDIPVSNTTRRFTMRRNEKNLKKYDCISDDVKYVGKSVLRLKILEALNEKPQDMKELADGTKLSYSSISSNLHGLELNDMVYRKSNKYYLSNSLGVQMVHILEFKNIVNLLDKFDSIIDGHIVQMIPDQSINELYLLENVCLLESEGVDAYKTYNFIESTLNGADEIQCVLPFYYETFNRKLNGLVRNGGVVEALISDDVFDIYDEKSEIRYVSRFKRKNTFLLLVSNEFMILGFFKDDGNFDQNRLLTSNSSDSVKWAKNLFKNFKKRNVR